MGIESIGGAAASTSTDDRKVEEKNSQQKLEAKKMAEKEAEKKRKAEQDLLNPVDRAMVTDQTHALGESIALSIISSVL